MCCSEERRVHSGQENSFVRKNGWVLPLNCLQVMSWLVLLYAGFIYFGVVALAVQTELFPATYICIGMFYVAHVVSYVQATSINPAHDNSLRRNVSRDQPLPVFDRTLHQHVIENCYCHICEVSVDPLTKHCSVCNKCVSVFDHHCKWLNNCIGKKNYRVFLATLLSAILGSVGMLAVSLYVFINAVQGFDANFYVWWKTSNSLQIAFEVLIGFTMFILVLAIALLTQLFVFHLMLINKGITTYEYVKRSMKKKEASKQQTSDNGADLDSGAVCNDIPEVIETPRNGSLQNNELFTEHEKEMNILPKHALIKSKNGPYSNGIHPANVNGSVNGMIGNHNLNNGGYFLRENQSFSPEEVSHTLTLHPKPSDDASYEYSQQETTAANRLHILPNSIPDSPADIQMDDVAFHPDPPKRGKRRRKKKSQTSIPLDGIPPRPLPQLSTVSTPSLPPIKDPGIRSSMEDNFFGADKRLPPLAAASQSGSTAVDD